MWSGDTLTASLVSNVSHGSLTLNSDGQLQYTPNGSFTGTDSFNVQAGMTPSCMAPRHLQSPIKASTLSATASCQRHAPTCRDQQRGSVR